MSRTQVETPATAARVERGPAVLCRAYTRALECLVVSATSSRRKTLAEAACAGGWKTAVFADAGPAASYVERRMINLALIDMKARSQRHVPDFRLLAEKLAHQNNLLLVVCGRESAVQEELWARQLGAWLYLPGAVRRDGVAPLCEEARYITEQLGATQTPAGLADRRTDAPAVVPASVRLRNKNPR